MASTIRGEYPNSCNLYPAHLATAYSEEEGAASGGDCTIEGAHHVVEFLAGPPGLRHHHLQGIELAPERCGLTMGA